jgi:Helicase associated domain
METPAREAIFFASDVEDVEGHSKPSFLEVASSNDDEIFDRTVLALLALSTKRPFFSTSSSCDSFDTRQENPTDTLVTPSSRIGRRRVASARARDVGATCQHANGAIKSKKAPSKSKKARSAATNTTHPFQSGSKKVAASVKSKKVPTTATKACSAPKKATTPSSASSSTSAYDSRWESMVSKLKVYHKKHGDCRVPRVYEADQVLSNWVHNQRYSKSLTQKRIDILNELDFAWTTIDTPQVSIKKKAKTGKHAGTTIREASSPRPLGNRDANRQPDGIPTTVKLTFSKAVLSRVQVEHKRKEAPVPSITPSTSRKAAKTAAAKVPPSYCSGQEENGLKPSKRGTDASLSKGSIDVAESRRAVHDEIWTKKFKALKAYFADHGDTFVPASYPSNQPLSNWIRNQRSAYRRGDLLQDRIERLDELCADWAQPQVGKPPRVAGMGSSKNGEAQDPEDVLLHKRLVLSSVDLTTPETSGVITASKVDYTSSVADANKLVVGSMVWSPRSNA